MKKRFISILLAALFLTGVVSIYPVSAIETPTLTVKSVSGAAGSQVSVTIDVSNNPGFCTARLNVAYDSKLTLDSAANGSLLPSALYQEPPSGSNPGAYIWASTVDSTANGTLLTLNFTVAADATGTLPVTVTYATNDIHNASETPVAFDIVNGGVTVLASAHFYGTDLTVNYNDEIVFPVSLENNPGFVATNIQINYDNTVLEYIPYGDYTDEAVGSVFSNFNGIFILNETRTSEGLIIFVSGSARNTTKNGVLLNLRFKVINDTFESSQVGITVSDFVGFGEVHPQFTITPGIITRDTSSEPVLIGLLGDTNGDDIVTAFDAVIALRIVAGLQSAPTGNDYLLTDINADTVITAYDAVLILRHVAGLSTGYDIGQLYYITP